ncbi:MAG: FadR/GntR family transcriptional regulator [Armatimonadota bacterium]|nr:FadR/GntR family transcriptional regulator [Armatimonadota bacterium]MDR7548635.1 FadR/GntR family transcriptional regulator [Armatimonadota bacterium]
MNLRLKPIQPVRLKEQAVRQIRRLIQDGALRPGDRLPSERQLSAQFQISRGTVREALQLLEAIGLLEIRQGEGAFVRATPGDTDGLRREWRDWVLRHRERVLELLEVREGLEAFVAELAAKRQGADGLTQMEEAVEQMAAGSDGPDIAVLVDADLLFHDGLARCAGNAVLRDLASTLGRQLVPERAAVFDTPGRPARSVLEHRQIYEAVRSGDPHAAHAAVRRHIASVRADMEAHLLQRPRYGGGSPP